MSQMYENIILNDGREGNVIDCMIDANVFLVEVLDDENEYETVEVIESEPGYYEILDNNDKIITLNARKGVKLLITDKEEYWFFTADRFVDESFSMNKEQYYILCDLLEIDPEHPEEEWHHFFEYHNFTPFLNAYKFASAEGGFYYVYGLDKVEKTADALYRCKEGKFERYFPREGLRREMPEQRMILNDKKPRYEHVTIEEGMVLAFL